MKIKYYLRGLGFGLLGAALILMAVQAISGKFGVSETAQQETTGSVLAYTKTEAVQTTQAQESTAQTTEAQTEKTTAQSVTQEQTTANQTTQAQETVTTAAAQKESDAPVNVGDNAVQINIVEGCTATQLSDLLFSAGVIDDRDGFIQYMGESGNSTKMRTGYFELTKGDSFENIAAIVTRKN